MPTDVSVAFTLASSRDGSDTKPRHATAEGGKPPAKGKERKGPAPSGTFQGHTMKIEIPKWFSIPNAGLASCLAVCGTNPMDRAKTLTQLPDGGYGKNIAEALRKVCKEEGVMPGLYRGLPVAMVREASKNMFRIGLFGPILHAMHDENEGPAPAWKRFLAGTCTGALGAVASNPFDLVKTRLQVPAAISEYNGMKQCMRRIYKTEGFGTFYRGVGASVTRDMLGSSVNLTVQSLVSEWFVTNHWLTPGSPVLGAISGVCSAAAAVAVMQPIDTARAYVYLKPLVHKDVIQAAKFIVANEGAWKLYKGSKAHFFRTAPHYAAMFAILEAITGAERNALHKRNVDILKKVPIFDTLSAAQRDALATGVRVKVFRRHEIIVKEGENSGEDREMFFVLRGNATSFVGKDRAGDSEKPSENVASRFFQKKKNRPGARALLDEDAPCASGTVCVAAEGDVWTSRGSLGAHFVQGDYFGEQALLVDEPRAASVQATSQKVECLVVDRRAYEQATKSSSGLLTDDNPNASSKKDVYYQRTSATKDVEMMWRRLRFQKELETVPLLATLSLYERSLLAKQCVRVTFAPGAKITAQGDKADKFYILVRGSAVAIKREQDVGGVSLELIQSNKRPGSKGRKKRKGDKTTQETEEETTAKRTLQHRVLRSYGPGSHFGELALLTNRPRGATVVAQERCTALVMDKDALLALRVAVPTLEDHILRGMRHYDHIEQFTSMAMA